MQTTALIYRTSQGVMTKYTPEDLSPYAFQTMGSQSLGSLLILEGTHEDTTVHIDYSRICTDHEDIAILDDWSEIDNILTNNDEYRIGYGWTDLTSTMSIPFSDVDIWDCMHMLNTFDIQYGDEKSDAHGIYALRWKLLDLRITVREDADRKPHLETSIPVVNGFVCYPVLREREGKQVLYAKTGAQLCWQEGIHRTPEIQLLDFHRFDEILIHPFIFSTPENEERPTDDTDTCVFMNRRQTFDLDARWKFITRLSLKEYTPIVVLCGIPLFPDQITLQHEHSFTIQPNYAPLNRALAYRYYLEDRSTTAENGCVAPSLTEYFHQDDMQNSSFIMYVKTPYVYTFRERMDVWSNYITVNNYTPDGILISDTTGTLAPYHREALTDRTELTLQNQESLFVSDRGFDDTQYVFFPPDCRHHQKEHKNLRESPCTMVYLMRGAK